MPVRLDPTDDWYRDEARRMHPEPDKVEERAEVARPHVGGAWVAVWVWVKAPELLSGRGV